MARPFHFTVDPASFFTKTDVGGTGTWTPTTTGIGIWVASVSAATNTIQIRNTDTSTNQTVEARAKHSNLTGSDSFGVVANWVDVNNQYLAIAEPGVWQLYTVIAGAFTVVGSAGSTISNDTYYRVKLTTVTDGSNKTLNLYVGGTLTLGPITATLIAGTSAGMWFRTTTAGDLGTFDWWAFNTAPTISTILPIGGASASGTSVTITGTDFGDGMAVTFGGQAGTSVVVTPTTSLTVTTPTNRSTTKDDVIVKFGTSGSEEYTATTTGGFIFGGGMSGEGFNGVV